MNKQQTEAHEVQKKISTGHGADVVPWIATLKRELSFLGKCSQLIAQGIPHSRWKSHINCEACGSPHAGETSKGVMASMHEPKSAARWHDITSHICGGTCCRLQRCQESGTVQVKRLETCAGGMTFRPRRTQPQHCNPSMFPYIVAHAEAKGQYFRKIRIILKEYMYKKNMERT